MLHVLRPITSHSASLSISLIFAINGLVFANWFARIPEVQNQLNLSEGELGLALLGAPLGALLIMPAMGWLIARYGAGRITLMSTIGCCLAITAPVLAWNLWSLGLGLLLLGVCNGAMDIAMNAEATVIENHRRTPILSTCHALFSLGGMVGAGTGSMITALGISPQLHLVAISLATTGLALLRRHTLLKGSITKNSGPVFAIPSKPLIGLAVMAFCIMLGEGAIADWSAVYLRNTLNAAPVLTGVGFASFSLGMTLGRLYGDRLSEHFGSKTVVWLGTLLAAGGLSLGLLLTHPYAGILGFGCVGLGYAGIVPILFRAAAHLPGMAAGTNIAAVASAGYTGFLIGPVLIGFAAEAVGLGKALGIVAVLAMLVNVLVGRVGISLKP
jgi:MFS family permease